MLVLQGLLFLAKLTSSIVLFNAYQQTRLLGFITHVYPNLRNYLSIAE